MGFHDDYKREAAKKRRDEFAKAALTGICACMTHNDVICIAEGTRGGELIAGAAWVIADKMIELEEKA